MRKNKIKSSLICTINAFLLCTTLSGIGCTKDGEEISGPRKPAGDLTGSWLVNQTISGNCPDVKYPITRTDIFIIKQSGNDLLIMPTSTGASFEGLISSDKVSWEMTVPEADGELKLNFSGTVSANGQTVTGQAIWTWSAGNLSCLGTAEISASKVTQPIENVSGKWEGNWQSSLAGLSGKFTTDITQLDGSLSGTITVPEIGLNKAELKGTVSGNTIAFGDINDQITFIGVLGVDTVSASGTYYYPAMGDYGSWHAEKSGSGTNDGLQILASFPIPGEPSIKDMTYDRSNFWILTGGDKIFKFSTDGNFTSTIYTPGSHPVGIAFDTKELRVGDSNWGNAKIFKLKRDN